VRARAVDMLRSIGATICVTDAIKSECRTRKAARDVSRVLLANHGSAWSQAATMALASRAMLFHVSGSSFNDRPPLF
jgi:hypothetical protein